MKINKDLLIKSFNLFIYPELVIVKAEKNRTSVSVTYMFRMYHLEHQQFEVTSHLDTMSMLEWRFLSKKRIGLQDLMELFDDKKFEKEFKKKSMMEKLKNNFKKETTKELKLWLELN
jgi:hypothetical protein